MISDLKGYAAVHNRAAVTSWERRGYSPDMGSAAVVPPPPEGFRRLYHLTSAEYALSDIVFKRLKVARFSALNDPFELLARAATDDGARRGIEIQKKALDDDLGLLCFSEDWTDPVLWTHYGSKHRGICLGFDVKEGLAKKVAYRTHRLSKEELGDKTEAELLEMLLYTKFESWKYEAEWRVLKKLVYLTTQGSLHFCLLDGDIRLREVILGAQCSTSFLRMRELIPMHHRDVNVIQGRLNRSVDGSAKEESPPLDLCRRLSAETAIRFVASRLGYIPWLSNTFWQLLLSFARFSCKHC